MRSNTPRTFRQSLSGLDLAVERATERTRDALHYHVILEGEVIGIHRTLRAAQTHFQRVKAELDYKPPERPDLSPEEMLRRQREFLAQDEYREFWETASRKISRPGRPRRR